MILLRRFCHTLLRLRATAMSAAILLLPACSGHWCVAAQNTSQVVTVSAAGYTATVAPESIVAAFGVGLAVRTEAATSQPLPTTLAGTTVRVNGEAAPLFFVSPFQVNYLIPAGTPSGTATVTVTAGDGKVSTGTVQIAPVAPALFTADSSGSGVLASLLLRVRANGQLVYEPLAQYDGAKFVTKPIDFGDGSDQLFLVLYLTGVRGAATSGVRVSIGGVEYAPLFVGPQGGFAGLDQINVSLPPGFGGRGMIELLVRATGYGGSNAGSFEIGSGPAANNAAVQISSLSATTVLASEELEINGSGFAANPRENTVQIIADDGVTTKAEVLSVGSDRLRARVPFGAGTGRLRVSRGQSEASHAVQVRTSVSGFVEESKAQPDGSLKPVPIPGARVRLYNQPATERAVSADGSFVIPDAPAGLALVEVVLPANGSLPFPNPIHKISVRAGRDNQLERSAELVRIGGAPFPGNTGDAVQEISSSLADGFTLTYFPAGRTPFNLPVGHFSNRIAQITPFRMPITPATGLRFPNADAIPVGTAARLFRFDQTIGSATLGQFIEAGTATVTADGQFVETAANAITEGSYYFVSIARPLAAINGRVVESDGRPVPRAIVNARGQSTFTDGFGGFVLRNVPVLKASGDRVKVEVSYQRPDGSISRKESSEVELTANALVTVTPEIALDPVTTNSPPVILAPSGLTLSAGETRDYDFIGLDPDTGQPVQVRLSDSATAFTTLSSLGQGVYRLRMNPAANAAGSYTLTLTATDAANDSIAQSIAVTITQREADKPAAQSQSITTPEDTRIAIALNGSDPGGKALSYTIVTPPSHGRLSGTAPNLSYTPTKDYNGSDSFTFRVSNGSLESQPATVFIAINPINDAPVLTAPGAQTANAGQELSFLVNAADPDAGQGLTCTAAGLPPGATLAQQTGTSWRFTWTPVLLQVGSYTVSFTLMDDGVPAQSDQRSVTVLVDAKWAKTSGPEGADIRAFAFKGTKTFAATSSGSLYLSNNDGQSWTPVSGGLPAAGFEALAVKEDKIFAAARDEVFVSRDDGQSWTLGSRDLVSNGADTVLALAVSGTRLYAGTRARGVYVSEDDGRTWVRMSAGLPANPVLTFGVAGTQIFAGLINGGIYTSSDGGRNWTSAGLEGQRINAIVTRGGKLFAAVYESGVFFSNDNGQSWTPVNQGLRSRAVITLSFSGAKLLVGTQYNGVFVSENEGQSWTPASQGLSDSNINVLATSGTRLYAGTLSGGVYTSVNQGQSWTGASQGLANAEVKALVVTPAKVFGGVFGGVAVTDNNGQGWTRLSNGLHNDQFIRALIVVGNKIFAGSNNSGVFLSTDEGAIWSFAGLESGYIRAFAVLDGKLFAGDEFGQLYVTSDDGRNWTQVEAGFPREEVQALVTRGSLLFAGLNESGVYLSRDQGQSWTPASNGLTNRNVRALAVSGGALYAGTSLGGVFVSRNDGQSWQPLNTGLTDPVINTFLVTGTRLLAGTERGGAFLLNEAGTSWTQLRAGLASVSVTTKQIYGLALQADNIIAATDDGAYLLASAAQSWAASNDGLANLSVNTVFATPQALFAGTLGGGVYSSPDQGRNWTVASAGLPANANVQALNALGGNLFAATYGDGVFRSASNGATWTDASSGLTNRYVTALVTRGSRLFAATTSEPQTGNPGGVFVSNDNGATWTASNAGLTSRIVNTLAAINARLFAGTSGGVFVSDDGGGSWTAKNTGLTGNALLVRSFAAIGRTIFAATDGGGIYRSTDGGESWAAVNTGLPPTLNVYTLATSGTRLYAGSIYGVFVTEDQGAGWKQVNAGLLDVFVTSLAVSGDRLAAGTLRGGVFVSRIPQLR